jgi:aspartyl-tRNA(Asn)/glutamyl-tRNA(Gln) amidotransferase subunit C
MKITLEQVRHIAHLARLEFNEVDAIFFTKQLDDILTSFDKLKEVDTSSVPPTSHTMVMKNVFREDVLSQSFEQELVLGNAPDQEKECFRVPKIIE